MKEERLSFAEVIRINRKGLKLIYSLIPWNRFWDIMMAVSNLLFSYWNYFFISRLVDHISVGAAGETLLYDVIFLVGGQIFVHITERYIMYYYMYCGSNVWELANARLNCKIMEMDYEYTESENIYNRKRDIDTIARYGGAGLNRLYWNVAHAMRITLQICVALGYTLYLIYQGRKAFAGRGGEYILFFVVFVGLLAGLVVLTIYVGKKSNKARLYLDEQMVPYNRQYIFYTEEYINREECGKNIRIFHQQNLLSKHINELFNNMYRLVDRSLDVNEKESTVTGVTEVLISGLIYFMLGILVLRNAITIGNVCLYAGCISMFLQHFRDAIKVLTLLYDNTKYVKTYFDFLEIPNRKYEGTLPIEKRTDDKYTIEFCDVTFRYPGSDVDVLKHFSIRFRIGERLALVGKNSSGKTTFIKLLCRLYDPTEGVILLNGIDIRKYDYKEYLSLFSVVFQDFKIPAFALGENVAASMDYDEEKVKVSLEKVGLSYLWDRMPNKLETPLYKDFDDKGVDISGGEAQKIAIARALYHDTPFVILDEPTAALDPLAEYEIYSRFDELVGTKTAVYISHRLSSCQFCDDILVIDGGQAVQRGNHEELLSDKEGLYYLLWNTQAQHYKEEEHHSISPCNS